MNIKNTQAANLKRAGAFSETLYYVDAPPSAGKTYQMCKFAVANRRDQNQLIVQPTDAVIRETEVLLKTMGVNPVVINGEVLFGLESQKTLTKNMQKLGVEDKEIQRVFASGKVIPVIDACLKSAKERGTVMIITHAAFLRLPYFHRAENWQIYFDECVQVDRYHEIDISHNAEVIKSRVQSCDVEGLDKLVQLVPLHHSKLKEELSDPDDVLTGLRDFFLDVNDPNQETFIEKAGWEATGEGRERLIAVSMLKGAKFDQVVILSANVKETMMFRWFRDWHGMKVVEHPINRLVKFNDLHHLKDRVRISYLTKGHTGYGSKNLARSYQTVIDQKALDYIAGREYAFSINNFYESKTLSKESKNCIPVIAHGLNAFDHHTIYFHNVTQNRNSNHLRLLEMLGLPKGFVTDSTVVEGAYQSAMRTNLRRQDSDQVVDIVVIGEIVAKKLAERFGVESSSLNYIGGEELDFKPKGLLEEKCNGTLNKSIRGQIQFYDDETPPQGSTYCVGIHKGAKSYNQLIVTFNDQLEVFEIFEEHSSLFFESKEDALMFNPSIFTDEGIEDGRGVRSFAQMVQANFIVLDIDGGTVPWRECADVFWARTGRGRKHSFMICNTFSNSPEKPNRYRLIFPLKTPIYSKDHYRQVAQKLAARIPKGANLDRSSFVAVQDYYMPGTNVKYMNDSEFTFFKKYGHITRDFNRCAINPESDEYRYKEPEPNAKKNRISILSRRTKLSSDADRVNRYVAEYQSVPVGHGLRNDALNKLGIQLFDYVDIAELERILLQAVGDDSKMKARVPGTVDSVIEFKRKQINIEER